MSKRLEEIQNELAISKGFEDFNHLLENTHEMEIIKSYFNKNNQIRRLLPVYFNKNKELFHPLM